MEMNFGFVSCSVMLEQKLTKFREIFSFFEVELRYFSVYRLRTGEKEGSGGICT